MVKIVYTIGTLKTGGAEVFVVNLIKSLNKDKFDINLIVLDKKNNTILEDELSSLNIKVFYLNKKEGFSIKTYLLMFKLLNKIKPSVIHGNIGGIIYVLLYVLFHKNINVIHTSHTLASKEFGYFKRLVLKYFYKRKKIIPVVINTENYYEYLRIYKINESLLYLINNGIKIKKFKNNKIFSKDEIRLGHVGRFEEVKNHKLIFKVYDELVNLNYNVSLRLVGSGSLLDKYRKEASNKNIFFISETSKVEEELEKIDFFIFPSFYEGMPLSLIEAMSCGCIILSSNVGGIKDLIVDGINGFKINEFSSSDYVNKIISLKNNYDKLVEISKNNINKAKEFSLEKMVSKYEKLYLKEQDNVKWTI